MSKDFSYAGRIAVVGGGRMGEAITGGLIAANAVAADRFAVVEPADARRSELSSAYGVAVTADGPAAVSEADVVLLAVKPQVLDEVVTSLAEAAAGKLVISIAAGASTARLEALLPEGTRVVRVMPNTPALVRQGMSVVSGGSAASTADVELARELFAAIGDALVLDERYQDAAGAISGSGPAYFALVVDALARAGVRHGLSRDVAQELAIQTMRGTADLIEATGQHPQAVIDAVSSPGGTTIAALEAMERAGIRSALADGVSAAVKRTKELGA